MTAKNGIWCTESTWKVQKARWNFLKTVTSRRSTVTLLWKLWNFTWRLKPHLKFHLKFYLKLHRNLHLMTEMALEIWPVISNEIKLELHRYEIPLDPSSSSFSWIFTCVRYFYVKIDLKFQLKFCLSRIFISYIFPGDVSHWNIN